MYKFWMKLKALRLMKKFRYKKIYNFLKVLRNPDLQNNSHRPLLVDMYILNLEKECYKTSKTNKRYQHIFKKNNVKIKMHIWWKGKSTHLQG